MRVWVDLTNSPHVLVMRPIVRALEQRGAEVLITARDFAQTLDLCELVDPPRPAGDPAWHLYVVRHDRSDDLAAALEAAGIGHKAYYRVPTHRQPAMRDYAPAQELPGTDEAARTHLAIPMSPVLSPEQAGEAVAVIRDAGLGRPH